MTITTREDAIKAASSVARDVADGRLSPADLEAQAVTELRALVGQVIGAGDPMFDLQCEIARGVLAADGIPTDELAEWLAVARHRAGEPLSVPEPVDLPGDRLPADSPASVALSPEVDALADTAVEPEPEPAPVAPAPVAPAPTPRPVDTGYNPLAGFRPGETRRY